MARPLSSGRRSPFDLDCGARVRALALNEQSPKPFQSCRLVTESLRSASSYRPQARCDHRELGSPSIIVRLEPSFSFGFVDISANFVQQRLRRRRDSNFAVKNVFTVYILAIHGLVSALV